MSKDEETRAIENSKPRMVIKEELGGDYFYRCPILICNKIIKSEYSYCPYCGARVIFSEDEVE